MRKIWSALVSVGGGVAIGLGSALTYLSEAGSSLVPDNVNWREAETTSDSAMLPYDLGHYLLEGSIPPSGSSRQFSRARDEDGNTLRGDCVFVLEGSVSTARWWTLAATNSNGTIIDKGAVLSSGQALLNTDGKLTVSFSNSPVAGNWIKVPSGTYSLALTLHDATDEEEKLTLPMIRRGRC